MPPASEDASKLQFANVIRGHLYEAGMLDQVDAATCRMSEERKAELDSGELDEMLRLSPSALVSRQQRNFVLAAFLIRGKHVTERTLRRILSGWTPFGESLLRDFLVQRQIVPEEAMLGVEQEAERYRYELAQAMNELQMKFISNRKLGTDDKPYTISREHWKDLPDFKPQHPGIRDALRHQAGSILALVLWSILAIAAILFLSKKAKAI